MAEATNQGALQQFISLTDLIQPLPTQLPGKHTRIAATGAISLGIQHSLAVLVPGTPLTDR